MPDRQKVTVFQLTFHLDKTGDADDALPKSMTVTTGVRHAAGDSADVDDRLNEILKDYFAHGIDHATRAIGGRGRIVRIAPSRIMYVTTELAPGQDIG